MRCAPLADDLNLTAEGQVAPASPPASPQSLAFSRPDHDCVDLRTLLREDLVSLDADARREIIQRLATSTSARPQRIRHELHRVREALRERCPVQDDVRGATRGLHVDGLLRIDATSFYVHGWAFDHEGEVASLSAWTAEGETIELLPRAFRFPHADADGFYSGTYRERASGFACFFHTRRADPLSDGWLVVDRNAENVGLEARAPTMLDDPAAAREVLLSHLRHDRDERLIREHVHPAIDLIQQGLTRSAQAADVRDFGTPSAFPAVSLVVGVFGRIDLIEHQIARLAHDPQARDAVELIYVLDSPELADEFRAKAAELVQLYGLSLRCVTMKRSSGQAGATNVGVNVARGRRVVLMHGDAVPRSGGWIGEMSAFLDARADVAAVGAALIYHDESIQHGGYKIEGGAVSQPAKGLHADLFASGDASAVDAVSGACMMLDRERFLAAGGFGGHFAAAGMFEDADFSARLTSRGGKIYLLPRTRLYHLEGQSRPRRLRELATPYDAWLFKQLRRGNRRIE
jgi:GT2 family glycosyltransferase